MTSTDKSERLDQIICIKITEKMKMQLNNLAKSKCLSRSRMIRQFLCQGMSDI